jgi:hypothetical protein
VTVHPSAFIDTEESELGIEAVETITAITAKTRCSHGVRFMEFLCGVTNVFGGGLGSIEHNAIPIPYCNGAD